MIPRLKELFYKEIQPALKTQFGFKNLYMGPKIEKIVLNMGLGLDGNDSKILKSCEEDLAKITGQKPVITKFKKSVANFKTRKGSNAGLKVTFNPAFEPLRVLKFATDFLNFVVTGFCPVILAISSSHDFKILESVASKPSPIFKITFSILGAI